MSLFVRLVQRRQHFSVRRLVYLASANFNSFKPVSSVPPVRCKQRHPVPIFGIQQYSKKWPQKNRHRKERTSDSDSDSDSDSSDDEGRRIERGQSAFWRAKMRSIHFCMDVNKDGMVSWEDFELLMQNFIKLGNLTPEQEAKFRSAMQSVWEEQYGPRHRYAFVSQEEYLKQMARVINDPELRKKVHCYIPYLFMAVDKDQSGEISVEEFKLYYNCIGLTDKEATASFYVMDTNKDGKLSLDEFVEMGRDYYLTENENSPSKNILMPGLD